MSLWPAYIAFGGVILGLGVNTVKDVLMARSKNKADRVYLSIMVGAELGKYIQGCHGVATDDGRPNDPWASFEDEERRPQFEPPKFKPMDMAVEWKVLPAQLLHDILDIPHEANRIESSITFEGMMDDDVPDHREFFWKRRELWAYMGLRVIEIASRLRKLSGLPDPPRIEGDWNLAVSFQEVVDTVTAERKKYEERVAAFNARRAAVGADS